MGALNNDEVGKYMNEHFVAAYQKVGTFRIVNGQKQGGNVASYFCHPDGTVLHAIAGPVDADKFLREARWVVESRKLAQLKTAGNVNYLRSFYRKAHADRLQADYHTTFTMKPGQTNLSVPAFARWAFEVPGPYFHLDRQAKVEALLANYPLVKIELIFETIFEKVLNEKVGTLPVAER